MEQLLVLLNNLMSEMHIPYTFDEWDNDVPLPQFIGELTEVPGIYEDGCNEYDFMLTGYAKDMLDLLKVSDALQKRFKPSANIDCVAIRYKNAIPVDTGTEELKQIQITLNLKDWRM